MRLRCGVVVVFWWFPFPLCAGRTLVSFRRRSEIMGDEGKRVVLEKMIPVPHFRGLFRSRNKARCRHTEGCVPAVTRSTCSTLHPGGGRVGCVGLRRSLNSSRVCCQPALPFI